MSEPISVLLIVGAAVIGPIDARYDFSKCVPLSGIYRESIGVCRESYAKTCERALKQIGAWQIAPSEYLQWDADKNYPPGTWWLDQKAPVRCIPTPAGYRR